MFRYLKLVFLFARVSIQDDAAYRLDFAAHIVMALVQVAAELVGLWTVLSNTNSLAGWSTYELLALLGVYRIMIGAITLFIAPNMRAIMEDIREGTLDYVLMKPLNNQFYASVRRVVVWRLMDFFLGAGLAGFACWKLSAELTVGRVGIFIVMLGAGIGIVYSVWLTLATCAFWFTRITNIEMVFWNLFEAGRYPIDIYRPWLRWGLTYIVPLAFLTTFPAASLIGKADPRGAVFGVLFAIVSLLLSSAFWRFGLRRYSGASA